MFAHFHQFICRFKSFQEISKPGIQKYINTVRSFVQIQLTIFKKYCKRRSDPVFCDGQTARRIGVVGCDCTYLSVKGVVGELIVALESMCVGLIHDQAVF